MTAIITENLRAFNTTQFINAFNQISYTRWQSGVSTVVGDVIYYGFYKYVAITTGTTGGTPPSHISSSASDGGVTWLFVENYENNSFYKNNLYIAIGRNEPWADEVNPDAPIDSFATQKPNIENIISAKRLSIGNVKLGIVRYDWTSGVVYNRFDPTVEAFDYSGVNAGAPFYVYHNDGGNLNIYKCIDNNNSAISTSAPTGQSINNVITADGYIWKFMGSVESADSLTFLSTNYIPVELKLDPNDTSPQALVQQAAKVNSISRINISNGGAGYTIPPTITFSSTGEDTPAVGLAIISGGMLSAVQLTNVGVGYTTTPTITITPDVADTITTPATAEAILAPKGGHGSNILEELNARYVIIGSRFEDTEGGYFPIGDDFREIFLIVDPTNDIGEIATELRYIGANHPDYITNPNSLNKLGTTAGSILYTESLVAVARQSGQIEDIKINIKM